MNGPRQRDRDHAIADATIAAARALCALRTAGTSMTLEVANRCTREAFGEGAWTGAERQHAVEAMRVMMLRRWGRAVLKRCAGPERAWPAIRMIAEAGPSHTVRSERQEALQQLSTPASIAWAAVWAARIEPQHHVAEPSAGTGMLVGCATAFGPAGVATNEIDPIRSRLLETVWEQEIEHSEGDALTLFDRLGGMTFARVVMNPPFSRRAGRRTKSAGTDVQHLAQALRLLAPGGRLVAVTAPGAWSRGLRQLIDESGGRYRARRTVELSGDLYARQGTTFGSRITVIDADGMDGPPVMSEYAGTVEALMEWAKSVPEVEGEARETPRKSKTTGTTDTDKPGTDTRPPEVDTALDGTGHSPARGAPIERIGEGADTGRPHVPWEPSRVVFEGAKPHPTPLVESQAMAGVPIPWSDYKPWIPQSIVDEAILSDAQLESLVLAGEAHGKHFVVSVATDASGAPLGAGPEAEHEHHARQIRLRRGWMLGDGTGTGKGRQIAGIILDQWRRGRRRAVWISERAKLVEDARRDWAALGGAREDLIPMSKVPTGKRIEAQTGILFVTYATLRQPAREGRMRRLEQIVQWLAEGDEARDREAFEGVLVFDESHAMGGVAGGSSAAAESGAWKGIRQSQQGLAGVALQMVLPDARVIYASATGASTVNAMAYAWRLGLWGGDATAFATREGFVEAMVKGGIAAMEVVARDLKCMGRYQARLLGFDGVEIEPLIHSLDDEERRVWDTYAGAFEIVHQNLDRALEAAGVGIDEHNEEETRAGAAIRRNAKSAFEGAKQRFFEHLLCGLKVRSVVGRN